MLRPAPITSGACRLAPEPARKGKTHLSRVDLRQKREEVKTMTLVWETPDFEEVAVTPEVTMYLGRMED